MNRKTLYGLLALPVVLVLVLLAILPGETRSTFFTEFKHRTRMMMGYEPEQYGDGTKGLRSEHPDEYGHAYDAEPAGGEAATSDSEEADSEETVEPAATTDEAASAESGESHDAELAESSDE